MSQAGDMPTAPAVDFAQLTPTEPREPAPSLEDAARQARALVAAAEAEAARIREEARATGHAEGFAAAREAARDDLAPAAATLAEAHRQLNELEVQVAERVESQAVDLAVHIAEKVVAGTIAVQPERVLDVVRGALRTIVERERVVVFVHPDDLGLMRDAVAELTGSLGGMEHLDVQEERRVRRGGAILRTSFGEVDARLETKLERAREAVQQELRG
jgi:flagellar biosynthesis/type III secretory pathway protein FliH